MAKMVSILNNRRERTRFLRFAFVGAIGSVIDFGVSNLLIQLFSVPLVIAGAISFVAAVLSNFTWNRYWTYPDSRSKALHHQLGQFFTVSIIGLGIRVVTLAGLEPIIHRLILRSPLSLSLPTKVIADNLTLAVAIAIVTLWNFFANRYWTYGDIQ